MFIIAIDFDGDSDRISRSILIRKLSLFGAGTIFPACIASIYMRTENIIFRDKDHMCYNLYAGIKQGLPLSPLLFVFYINDLVSFLDSIYTKSTNNIYELIHILLHADDATVLASAKGLAVSKVRSMLHYCRINCIVPRYTKSEFVAINGNTLDKEPIPFDEKNISHVEHLSLLGSHISCSGRLDDDLNLDYSNRFRSCIKFYNFLRSNKIAPLTIKLKVLKACVISSLLHNCETFSYRIPKDLEKQYYKLIKCALQVRQSTPNLLVLIESGLLPLKAIIISRQFKFFKRFSESLRHNSARRKVFHQSFEERGEYIQHYISIDQKYNTKEDIYREFNEDAKQQIRTLAEDGHYKYQIYFQYNPSLVKSNFIDLSHPLTHQIIKFRLGSHKLPIETGRWSRIPREERVCSTCGVLGDELHFNNVCE